jgi:predicted permease
MQVITTLSPVFVMILLGYLLRRWKFLSECTVRELSWLVYWIGLPCLLFYKTSTNQFLLADCGRVYGVLLISVAGSIAATYGLAWMFRIAPSSASALVQGAFRGNLAFVGLPILLYSVSDAQAASAEATAVFVLALMVVANNMIAVPVLLMHQHRLNRQAAGKIAVAVATNPLLLACVAGMAAGHFIRFLPAAVERTLAGFSQMVLPLALISVGAAIRGQTLRHHFLPAMLASVVKLGLCPLIGYLAACCLIPLSPEHLRLAMIFMACPTAAASYVLADQLGGDQELTAAIVTLSSVLSIVSLSVVVGLF